VKIFRPFAPFTLPSGKTSRCAPGECRKGNRVDAFNGDLNQTMWSILPLLNATHTFVNVGWAELEEPIDNLKVNSDLSCKILDFEASYPDIDVTLESHSSPGVCSTNGCKFQLLRRQNGVPRQGTRPIRRSGECPRVMVL